MDSASYLFKCRENYLNQIFPNSGDKNNKAYLDLTDIANKYVRDLGLQNFALFFMEGQYLVDLWTAHIIIAYHHPDDKLKSACLEIIARYAETPLNPILADQEKTWLASYKI